MILHAFLRQISPCSGNLGSCYIHNPFMPFLASVHFSVQSLHCAQVPGFPLWLLQTRPAGPGASHPVPEQQTLPLARLAIKQQFCPLRNCVFCLQPPHAASSCTCTIVSEQSVINKLLSPLPGPCRSQLPQIPSQQQLCWINFLPSREIFDRYLLLFCRPVLLRISSEVLFSFFFGFCRLPIIEQ